MAFETLWETICRLSGETESGSISVDEAVSRSAVPKNVAVVEIRRMAEDGLIEASEESIQLTERGRKTCTEVYHIPGESEVAAPEMPIE